MQHLSAEKQKEVFDSYIEGLKKNYKVEINKEALSILSSGEEKKEEHGKNLSKQENQKKHQNIQ